MSLYGMMRTGVSGMNAQANRLSTVADNIANSGTTGYKRSSTEFASLIIPSTTGNYTSGGVTTTTASSSCRIPAAHPSSPAQAPSCLTAKAIWSTPPASI
jgi:flagellar basal body rod protein FlgG